jgi:hypothetical protein
MTEWKSRNFAGRGNKPIHSLASISSGGHTVPNAGKITNVGIRDKQRGQDRLSDWLRGLDLNQRPLGYEPNELPDCFGEHKFRKLCETAHPASGDPEAAFCSW